MPMISGSTPARPHETMRPRVAPPRARSRHGALAQRSIHADSLVVLDERLDAVAFQPITSLEEPELDEELRGYHDAAQALDEAKRGGHGAAGGVQVVHDQVLLALSDGVLVKSEGDSAII